MDFMLGFGSGDFYLKDMLFEMRNLLLFSKNLLCDESFCEWDAFEIATSSAFLPCEYFAIKAEKFLGLSEDEMVKKIFWTLDESDVLEIE